MHEYGIAVDIANAVMKAAGGRKIRTIRLQVGALSGIFVESLLLYCDLVMKERTGGAVAVEIENIRAGYRCTCGRVYETGSPLDPCPSCGRYERTAERGLECTIESVEVDDG
jgi:hydrogenase nickel incorporation protein HypA/HybF